MKTKLMVTAAACALLFGSAAVAQPASSPPATGDASSAAQGGGAVQSDFTDDQLKSFAEVTMDLQRQQSQGAALDPAAMSAKVESSGLTVEEYNQIATRMRSDQAFNTRVQQLAQASAGQTSQGGASSSQSTESMTAPESSPSAGSMGPGAGSDSTAPPSASSGQ